MWTGSTRSQYERQCRRYATDLKDAEFALIEPFPPPARRGRLSCVALSGTRRPRRPVRALYFVLRIIDTPIQFPPS